MSEQQIKEYLNKYSLTTKEKLAQHIEQLKVNTKPNIALISELVYVLADEENLFFNLFCENNTKDYWGIEQIKRDILSIVGDLEDVNKPPQRTVSPHFLDEVLEQKEKVYTTTVTFETNAEQAEEIRELCDTLNSTKEIKTEENLVFPKDSEIHKEGIKESQSTEKAPVFTYCKVNKNALEALSLRALYGHIKYKETDEDWQNFTRVPNALEEYANAEFRHALEIGREENEKEHLIASAWNAVARLEIYLRDNGQ